MRVMFATEAVVFFYTPLSGVSLDSFGVFLYHCLHVDFHELVLAPRYLIADFHSRSGLISKFN